MINVVKMAFEFEHEFSMNTNKLNQHNYTKSSKEYLCVRLTPFNVNIGNEIQIHTYTLTAILAINKNISETNR